jgi:hypothetical protein
MKTTTKRLLLVDPPTGYFMYRELPPNMIRMVKSRRMRWTGHVARMGRSAYKILVCNPEGKRPLGRPRLRWIDSIREIGWRGMVWIDLAQDRDQWRALVNTVMNLRVP